MVSTKITSNNVADIDAKLKTYIGDMVKIEYLENCLKQMIPNDASRFCHLKLSDLYATRLMFGPAAKQMDAAAETSVTFRDKISCYMKEMTLLIKVGDYLMIDKAYKHAMVCATSEPEKNLIKAHLKNEMMKQAWSFEEKNKRSNAAVIYQRLLEMPLTNEDEKKNLIVRLASLNAGLGRLKEAVRYEQMSKRPLEIKKDPETNVKKFSWQDLGIE